MNRVRQILIVDDTDANRYVLRKILAGNSAYQLLEASTGAMAIELLNSAIDLMIVDINLPDMTGFELIQAAERKLGRGRMPSVINISATLISGKDKAAGLNQGAQAYLTHPINPDEVLATINSLLKSSNRLERAEKQRNVAIARSENLQAEKIMLERFMRSLSHDLRSPLTTANMVVNLMQRTPARRTDDMLKLIEDNLQRINQMITNVLDISHMSLGGVLRLNGEDLVLGPLVEGILSNLRIQIANPLLSELESPELEVHWDKPAFMRILDNLVINAAKHGEAGKPIRVVQRRVDSGLSIAVINRGSLPEEVLTNLATPYFISSRSDVGGWGLGMPIVKALAESFGGVATFGSQDGEVTVQVYLPTRVPEARG